MSFAFQADAIAARQEIEYENTNGPVYRKLFHDCYAALSTHANAEYLLEYFSIEFHESVMRYDGERSFLQFLIVKLLRSRTHGHDQRFRKRLRGCRDDQIESSPEATRTPQTSPLRVYEKHLRQPYIQQVQQVAKARTATPMRHTPFYTMCDGLSGAAMSLLGVLVEMQDTDSMSWAHLFVDDACEELSRVYPREVLKDAVAELRSLIEPQGACA